MRLLALFRLQRQYENAFDEQQARMLNAVTWIVLIVAALATVFVLIAVRERYDTFRVILLGSPISANPALFLPIVLSVSGLVLFLLQRGALEAARTLFVGGALFAVILLNFLSGDNSMQSRSLLGYVIPIVAAGVLLPRSGVFLVTTAVLMALGLQLFAISIGLLNYPPTAPTPAYLPFVFAVFAVTGSMLYFFGGSQRALLQANLNLINELGGIAQLSRLAGTQASVENLLNTVIALLHEKLNYYHVQVFLMEERSGVLSLAASTSSLEGDQDGGRRRLPPNSPSVIAEVARTGVTQRIGAEAPPLRRSEFLANVRAELVVPLRLGSETLGVLDVQATSGEAFTPREIEGLEALATQLALAIHSLRLQQAMQILQRDQQELITQVQTASREIDRLNQELSGRAWKVYFQSRSEKSISFDWDGDMIKPSARPVPMPARGPYGYVPYIETREGAQYLVVPIISDGQAIGVMEFRAPDGQFWDDRSVELAQTIAQRLALSLDNIRLYDQAQMAITREQTANSVAAALQAKSSDIDTLVTEAVDIFQQVLGASQTSVRLGVPQGAAPNAPLSNGRPETGAI